MDSLGLASGKAMGESAASSSLSSTSTPAPAAASSSSASASTAETNAPVVYGRIDAENEDNLELIRSVAEHGVLGRAKLLRPSPVQIQLQPSAQRRDDATMQGTAASSKFPPHHINLCLCIASYLHWCDPTLHLSFFHFSPFSFPSFFCSNLQ